MQGKLHKRGQKALNQIKRTKKNLFQWDFSEFQQQSPKLSCLIISCIWKQKRCLLSSPEGFLDTNYHLS